MATAQVGAEAEILLYEYEALKRLISTHKEKQNLVDQAPQSSLKRQFTTPFNYKSASYYAAQSLPSSSYRGICTSSSSGIQGYALNQGHNNSCAPKNTWSPHKYNSVVQKSENRPNIQANALSSRYKFQQTNVPGSASAAVASKFKLVKSGGNSAAYARQISSRMLPAVQSDTKSPRKVNTSYKWSSTVEQKPPIHLKSPRKVVARPDNRTFDWAKSICRLRKSKAQCSNKRMVMKVPYSPAPIIRSKYKLVKQLRLSPNKTPSRSVRHVNAYSIKYVPLKTKRTLNYGPIDNKSSRHPFKRTEKSYHWQKKSNLIAKENLKLGPGLTIIGGLVYKTSKTKLSRKGSLKTNIAEKTRQAVSRSSSNKKSRDPSEHKIITVRGIKYSMDSNRKVLRRIHAFAVKEISNEGLKKDVSVRYFPPNGPSRIDIGGETYVQTKPGVLRRSSTTHLRSLANRAINRSIYRLKASQEKSKQYCMFYNKFGKCNNKEKRICPYIHDAEKVAVCKRYLRGECTVQNCPFSHKMCRSKMPVCTFFLHGRCNNDSCVYSHVNVNPRAEICLNFVKGYCSLGEKCKKWHVTVCQQFEHSGHCDKGSKCPLLHRKQQIKANSQSKTSEIPAAPKRMDADEEHQRESEDQSPRKRVRLPSFISINENTDCTAPEATKSSDSAELLLQIMPDFVKRHNQESVRRVSAKS